MEIEAVTQSEGILKMENREEKRNNRCSITNRIQEMEEKLLGIEDTIEKIDNIIPKNVKSKKFLTQNIQEI